MSEVLSESESKCWWLTSYGITDFPATSRGAGVTLAVLDSGLNAGYDDFKGVAIKRSVSFVKEDSSTMDSYGHGTNCAAMIIGKGPTLYGVAPAASIIVGRVATSPADITEESLCDGIDWAVQSGAKIISVSFFIGGVLISPDGNLSKSISRASENNVLVVAAVGDDGNAGYDVYNYPASFPQCVSVGAVDRSGAMAPFTTSNSRTRILAPGVSVPAVMPVDGKTVLNGTSFSTPFVAGVLAMMMAISSKASRELVQILLGSCNTYASFSDLPGSHPIGIINPKAAMERSRG